MNKKEEFRGVRGFLPWQQNLGFMASILRNCKKLKKIKIQSYDCFSSDIVLLLIQLLMAPNVELIEISFDNVC